MRKLLVTLALIGMFSFGAINTAAANPDDGLVNVHIEDVEILNDLTFLREDRLTAGTQAPTARAYAAPRRAPVPLRRRSP